jgi:Ca2+-binding EF-hand superfamily protein
MRQRLVSLSNGSQEEYVLRDMFRTFDRDNNGYLTINELAGMLAKLGVEVSKDGVIGVLNELDTNKSGTL